MPNRDLGYSELEEILHYARKAMQLRRNNRLGETGNLKEYHDALNELEAALDRAFEPRPTPRNVDFPEAG